jgi:hypothetical protein
MGNWTAWRKLADKKFWYANEFDHEGPACYELGVGEPRNGNILPVYVGETANEKKRLIDYARHGSHPPLTDFIDKHLKEGYTLYYRAQAMPSKSAAKRMQDNLLNRYQYA